jgi:hypothetical protein
MEFSNVSWFEIINIGTGPLFTHFSLKMEGIEFCTSHQIVSTLHGRIT